MTKVKIIFSNGQSKVEIFSKGHKVGDFFYDFKGPSPFKLWHRPIKVYEVVSISTVRGMRVERVRRHPQEGRMIKRLQNHRWFSFDVLASKIKDE